MRLGTPGVREAGSSKNGGTLALRRRDRHNSQIVAGTAETHAGAAREAGRTGAASAACEWKPSR
jgi:hypothetical protein